jgi:hypothetical protein
LADKIDKSFWAVFACQYLIDGGGRVRHQKAFNRFVIGRK